MSPAALGNCPTRTRPPHRPGWRWGVTLYAILIMAATVFVKQHAAIDVLAGLLTGAIAYVFVYVIVGRRRDRRLGRDC